MPTTIQLSNQKGILYRQFWCDDQGVQYIWAVEVVAGAKNTLQVNYRIIPDGTIYVILQVHQNILYYPIVSAPFVTYHDTLLPYGFTYRSVKTKRRKKRDKTYIEGIM